MEHDDPIAYLSGEGGQSLPADQRADLDELRAMLSDPAVWEEPPAGLEASIVQAIGEEARDGIVRPAPARWWRAVRRLPSSPRRIGLAALAAAAVAALIVALSLPGAGPGPERFAMAVSGTSLAPEAHGSATLTKRASGWEGNLSATGLPRLSGIRYYYQAWLGNRRGVLVPVGTFNDARQVTLWSGVPVTQFRTLIVTVQQVGGSPASPGRSVLIGTVKLGG
jgi:hypothetical protein